MNTKARGDIGEQIACEYLEKKGYRILHRNLKLTSCEVDIVAEAYFDDFVNLISQKRSFSDLFAKLLHVKPRKKNIKKQGERTLVFVEVKTRESEEHGAPEEAVDAYKKGRYVTAAKSYIVKYGEQNTPVRFDVIAIEDDKVNHIENAFTENDARYPKNL